MIVLHSAFNNEQLLLWAEQSGSRSNGKKGTYPFAAPEAVLREAAERLGIAATKQPIVTVTGWMPTHRGKPLVSSRLVDEELRSDVTSRLEEWLVPTLRLDFAAIADLFANQIGSGAVQPGLAAGDDLRYWQSAYSFACGLVVRQRYLPGVRQVDKGVEAIWEPIIAGEDMATFTALAQALPGVCRAFLGEEALSVSRLQVLHRFVSFVTDRLVRAANQIDATPTMVATTTVHDRWLRALHSQNPLVEATRDEARALQTDIGRWKRPINTTLSAPFRLVFRLEEPALDPAEVDLEISQHPARFESALLPWQLSYLLQSTSDPSLIIPASSVWSNQKQPAVIERTKYDAREYLLASLGAASMLYPPVEASLLHPTPSDAQLDVHQAYRFLYEHAALLQSAGFGVMLPSWWTRKGARRRMSAGGSIRESKLKTKGNLSLDTLVDFKWQIAIGDTALTKKDLEELAKLKTPLIRFRGEWVEIQPEQLKAALDFLKKGDDAIPLRQLIQLSLGALELPAELPFHGTTGSGWAADLVRDISGEFKYEEIPTAPEFHGELRPYQQRGFSWLHFLSQWGLGACLADDMGLGKTVQTLAMIQKRWDDSEPSQRKPVLLICPMSVVGNWQREASRFTPNLPVVVHHGAGRKKDTSFIQTAKSAAIVLSSYSLLARDITFLRDVPWQGIVLDEAQNIKNPSTNQARAALALDAGFKIGLTGTPVENNVGDLWSLMQFLNPGLLGDLKQFRSNFLIPIQVDKDEEAADRLRRLTSPFILRRLKTDKNIISDLPEKLEMKVFCNLTKEQASLYSAVVKDTQKAIEESEGIERKGMVLALLSKLKQICNHPAQFLHDDSSIAGRSGKLLRISEMLEEALQVGDRALIFTQFAEMGEMLKTYLQETFAQEVLFLHGGVTKTKRERLVDRFQNDADAPQIFILSLKAGGVGLNLTRANQVFHYDRWWNPAVENQATDRAFRIGQTKAVQVHKFVCGGTLEEKIDQMIEDKKALAENVIGTGEGWLTELDNKQLRDLVALSKDAVAE
jgi:SNF2 family DNA or RNA helicase